MSTLQKLQQTTHLQRPNPLIKLFSSIPMEIHLQGHIFVRFVAHKAIDQGFGQFVSDGVFNKLIAHIVSETVKHLGGVRSDMLSEKLHKGFVVVCVIALLYRVKAQVQS